MTFKERLVKAREAIHRVMVPEPIPPKLTPDLQKHLDGNMLRIVWEYYELDDNERSFIDDCRTKIANGLPLQINDRNQIKEIVSRGY